LIDYTEDRLKKYTDFVSWCRWNPDLWYDLITPETGGIKLDLDQRVFLRCITRFISTYGVFPRGYGKTFLELLGMVHTAIFFPDIEISMTAQTQEQAAKLVDEKWREIIKYFPLIEQEISGKPSITTDSVEIKFKSNGIITILANSQSSKGSRRHRLQIEESALLNNSLFEDALEPIVEVPRRTIGPIATIDPQEMNSQINFFTTAGYRGSDEYERSLRMLKEMRELKGKIVIGANWKLALNYKRGQSKAAILNKKENAAPTFFAQNYESKWTGTTSGSLVDIKKLLKLRCLDAPEFTYEKGFEYILSVDVARSAKDSNNQSSVAVLKAIKNKIGKLKKVQLVNLINFKNGLNFRQQGIEVKRIRDQFNASVVVLDTNGIGSGLRDELMQEVIDPKTKKSLGCWDTINTDQKPEIPNSPKYIYEFVGQALNHDGIVSFMDMIESERLQLLIKDVKNNLEDLSYSDKAYPHIQTDLLIDEIQNLKTTHTKSGKLSVEQQTKRVNKDRYSALMMGLWYVGTFLNKVIEEKDINPKSFSLIRKPKVYGKRKGASF
jgi:ribonucleoside-diphosphate reductase alpha chain